MQKCICRNVNHVALQDQNKCNSCIQRAQENHLETGTPIQGAKGYREIISNSHALPFRGQSGYSVFTLKIATHFFGKRSVCYASSLFLFQAITRIRMQRIL